MLCQQVTDQKSLGKQAEPLYTLVFLLELLQQLSQLVLKLRELQLLQCFDDVLGVHGGLVVRSTYLICLRCHQLYELGATLNHQVHCGSSNPQFRREGLPNLLGYS